MTKLCDFVTYMLQCYQTIELCNLVRFFYLSFFSLKENQCPLTTTNSKSKTCGKNAGIKIQPCSKEYVTAKEAQWNLGGRRPWRRPFGPFYKKACPCLKLLASMTSPILRLFFTPIESTTCSDLPSMVDHIMLEAEIWA